MDNKNVFLIKPERFLMRFSMGESGNKMVLLNICDTLPIKTTFQLRFTLWLKKNYTVETEERKKK